jgi:hypothetical protein
MKQNGEDTDDQTAQGTGGPGVLVHSSGSDVEVVQQDQGVVSQISTQSSG